MPRSLWVIELLTPKMKEHGNEWTPQGFEFTKREAMKVAAKDWGFERCPVWRVRRWSPAGRS